MKFFLLFFFYFFSFSAFCKNYQLTELIELAEQNSVNIKVAKNSALAQKSFANQQKYWNNPVASINKEGKQNTYTISDL